MLHQPVMCQEILEQFKHNPPLKNFLDGTFGRGGHTREILKSFPQCHVTALDRDLDAVSFAKVEFQKEIAANQFEIIHTNFADFNNPKNICFDGILLDLGVSSPQLDVSERGFSFYQEGPLDMRMDITQQTTAADIVNTWDEKDLADLFYEFGEERKSFRVAKAITQARQEKSIDTTLELSQIIEKSLGWKKKGKHPATKCFLALRIAVNEEFSSVSKGIEKLLKYLNKNCKMIVLTFHSTEDRLVKRTFDSLPQLGKLRPRKVIKPSREEIESNLRSRSVLMRVFERNECETT